MNKDKIFYWLTTGLVCFMMTVQGLMSFFNKEAIVALYQTLGFPAALVLPLGIAKLLAVIAILFKKVKLLKSLAYYGLAIDFLLAIGSHVRVGDGLWLWPLFTLVLLVASFVYDRKLFSSQ